MVTSSKDYSVISRDMEVMKLCRRDVFQTLVNINMHLIKMTACAVMCMTKCVLLVVLSLFKSYKWIISYDRAKLKSRQLLCAYMVDFRMPSHK